LPITDQLHDILCAIDDGFAVTAHREMGFHHARNSGSTDPSRKLEITSEDEDFPIEASLPPNKRTAGVRPNLGLKQFGWSLMSTKGSNVCRWFSRKGINADPRVRLAMVYRKARTI